MYDDSWLAAQRCDDLADKVTPLMERCRKVAQAANDSVLASTSPEGAQAHLNFAETYVEPNRELESSLTQLGKIAGERKTSALQLYER